MDAKLEKTLNELKTKIEERGDLPVFSATVNQICSVSSDPDADVMSLSQEVLKDANLCIKLLRLANSPYYNRGGGKVGVVSRAIVLLGFDTVKSLSLTMKFIESFQNEHPSIDMDKLLVRAFITAGFVRDIALKIGVKDAEETYTCALLHQLGEIAVANYLPEKYIEITSLNKEGENDSEVNEVTILGATMQTVGSELAASWDFSSRIVATMDNEPVKISGQITKPLELNKALASLASSMIGSLYTDNPADEISMREMMVDLSTATGMRLNSIESSLSDTFKMSCDLAKDYGLSAKKLMPVVADTGDDSRDKLASQFSFYVSNQVTKQKAPAAEQANGNATETDEAQAQTSPEDHPANSDSQTGEEEAEKTRVDQTLQLQFIQEITSLITDASKLNTVLIKVMEGIHVAAGFPRVLLCLLGVDRKSYSGRIAIGTDKDLMKEYFNRPLNPNNDIFSRVLVENVDILVDDSNDERWTEVLPNKFLAQVGARSFTAAPLKSGPKPLGFVYADNGHSSVPITPEQHRAFIQFIAQARLAFQTCR
jgi:HD-like signal output (HDOD) protein